MQDGRLLLTTSNAFKSVVVEQLPGRFTLTEGVSCGAVPASCSIALSIRHPNELGAVLETARTTDLGATWTETGMFPGNAGLAAVVDGVTCQGSCWLYGQQHWAGSTSEILSSSPTGGASACGPGVSCIHGPELMGEACVVASCAAVGGDGIGSISEIVGGKLARTVTVPGTAYLYGVSCPSASTCLAVGIDHLGTEGAVVSFGFGSTGPVVRRLTEVKTAGAFWHVACSDAHTCYAAGVDVNGGGGALATVVDGHLVSDQVTGGNYVSDLSCSGKTCLVVGEGGGGPSYEILVDGQRTGGGPQVARYGSVRITSLGCASSGQCLAVGTHSVYQLSPYSVIQPIDTDGTMGHPVTVGGSPSGLDAVTCDSAACLAVGGNELVTVTSNGIKRHAVAGFALLTGIIRTSATTVSVVGLTQAGAGGIETLKG